VTRVGMMEGKVVVVTFWASWCGYCRKELPALNAMQTRAGPDFFRVVAVNVQDGNDEYRAMTRQMRDYTLTFAPGQLPPVDAFWSVTMYDGKTRFLVDNPLNRYLINSTMLPMLKKNADGGITLYLQHASPGAGLESNWLPAPNGPMGVVMRLYLPKPSVLDGQWVQPKIESHDVGRK